MILQWLATVSVVLLCALLAMSAALYRFSGRVGWLMANGLVALTGVLSLWLAPNSAVWLTIGLFLLLVACPMIFLYLAAAAARKGRLALAARLQRLAAWLHPSPQLRFGAALSEARNAAGPNGEAVALVQIEASGTPCHRALARLMLAHERRAWEHLLTLARAGDLPVDVTKPRELRALGELGRNDEMVLTYESAKRSIPPHARHECLLFVLAFTGQVDGVEQLLRGRLSAADDDSKTYWRAVARLRKDARDATAYATLRSLAEAGTKDGTRLSAVQQLQRVDNEAHIASRPLAAETQRTLEAIVQGPVQCAPARREQRERRRRRRRILLWLILLCLIGGVIEGYFTFHHVARTH
jgi:hypothetical protein